MVQNTRMKLDFIKSKQINWLIKLSILILLGFVLYRQIFLKPELDLICKDFTDSIEKRNVAYVMLIIALVPFNWVLETMKWRAFMNAHVTMRFGQSLKAILSGITMAILTPNRIGEYGGRLLHIPPKNNWDSVIATFVGSVAQNIATLFFGLISVMYLKDQIPFVENVDLRAVYFAALVFLTSALYIFFNVDLLAKILKTIRVKSYFERFQKYFQKIRQTDKKVLAKMLAISICRYLIYASQYYLATRFFGVDIDPVLAYACISTILLIQSGIPLPPFLSIFARGEIALLIWGLFEINELTILGMTFSIWLINLAIPAMLGSLFILNTNILQALGYGKKQR